MTPSANPAEYTLHEVSRHSPYEARRRVFACARKFARETMLGLMFHPTYDAGYTAYLWLSSENKTCGAACFRHRAYTDAPPEWALQWVRLDPRWQRRGLLSEALPRLSEKLGQFAIEGPLSPSMRAWCKKHAMGSRVVRDFEYDYDDCLAISKSHRKRGIR